MTPPPMVSPRLLLETLGFLLAIVLATWGLSMWAGYKDNNDQFDAGAQAP